MSLWREIAVLRQSVKKLRTVIAIAVAPWLESEEKNMSAATQNEMQRLRDQVRELESENASVLNLLATIRTAAGDAEGRLMQDDLVQHIQRMWRAVDERDELQRELDSERYHRRAVEESEAALAAHVDRLRRAMNEASNKHIAFAKRIMQGCDSTAMAAVDKADDLLVRESYYVPVDLSCLDRRDAEVAAAHLRALIRHAEPRAYWIAFPDTAGGDRFIPLSMLESEEKALRQHAEAKS